MNTTNYDALRLRAAIGITSADFELSEQDYYTLFEFDPPNVYEIEQAYDVFKESCKQVKAKYPTMAMFKRIYRRYDAAIEAE